MRYRYYYPEKVGRAIVYINYERSLIITDRIGCVEKYRLGLKYVDDDRRNYDNRPIRSNT